MNRHLLSFTPVKTITSKLVCHLTDGQSSPEEETNLSVLREDQVTIIKSSSGGNRLCLLSLGGHVETDSVLSLSHVEDLISLSIEHHCLINLNELILRDSIDKLLIIDKLAILINDSEALMLLGAVSELHLGGEVEFVEIRSRGWKCGESSS